MSTLTSSPCQRSSTCLFQFQQSSENQCQQGPTLRRRPCLAFILSIVTSVSTANGNALEPTLSNNASSILTSLSKEEEDDLLNSFGEGLSSSQETNASNSGWPNSPSPLPTASRTAAELTNSSIERKQQQQQEVASKDDGDRSLENIMKESQGRKRIINPMTHG